MKKLGLVAASRRSWRCRRAAGAGDLRLSIANGRVTIVAQDVSIRQILDEWGRVGQTKVVGAERLTGPSVTLELNDVPEGRALETLLRSASGYIAKPRSGTVGASSYDRILIMPASRPPAMSAAAPTFNSQAAAAGRHAERGRSTTTASRTASCRRAWCRRRSSSPVSQRCSRACSRDRQPAMPTLTRPGMLPPPAPNVPGNPYQTNPQQPIIRPPGVPGGLGGGRAASAHCDPDALADAPTAFGRHSTARAPARGSCLNG